MDTPKHRRVTFLAVVPGILIVLQNAWPGGAGFPFVVSAVVAILLLIVFRLHAKSGSILGISMISICGSLVWEAYQLLLVMYGGHLTITLVKLVLGIGLVISLVWLLKSGRRIYRIFGLIVALLIALGLLTANLSSQLCQFVGLEVATWLLRVIPFLVMGILICKKDGVGTAVLFITVCELFWLQTYLAPAGIEAELREASEVTTQAALWLYRMLPPLILLILSPLVVLLSKRSNRISPSLLALSLMTICIMSFLRTNLLTPPYETYIWPKQFMWIAFVILLWTPVPIAFLLYRNLEMQPAHAPAAAS